MWEKGLIMTVELSLCVRLSGYSLGGLHSGIKIMNLRESKFGLGHGLRHVS